MIGGNDSIIITTAMLANKYTDGNSEPFGRAKTKTMDLKTF